MLLRDQLLMVASALRDGDCSSYHQIVASRRLQRVAESVQRMEQQLDGIVADSQSEEHLLAVSERRGSLRVVSR
jgi:hypothetical protein